MSDVFHIQETLPSNREIASRPPIPHSIAQYSIESLLHRGVHSTLFLAKDTKTHKMVALKVIQKPLSHSKASKKNFLKEASVIQLATHTNIVKLFGYGEWETCWYIAMEYIQGISLRQFLFGQPLPLKRTLDIMLQAAYAVLHLHSNNILHRDVKPENILITENGTIKVIDFGIAHTLNEAPKEARGSGTPNYMSPEQKQGNIPLTQGADVYSLGVVLYELITGKLSFGTIDLNIIPEALKHIVKKCIEEKAENRYTDVVDLITDISQGITAVSEDAESVHTLHLMHQFDNVSCISNISSWEGYHAHFSFSKSHAFTTLSECHHYSDDTTILFIIEPVRHTLQSSFESHVIKGFSAALLHDDSNHSDFEDFVNRMSFLIEKAHFQSEYRASFLHIDGKSDVVHFIGCGCEHPFIYSTEKGDTILLESSNKHFGSAAFSLAEIASAPFFEGDRLYFGSFSHASNDKENIHYKDMHSLSVEACAQLLQKHSEERSSYQDHAHIALVVERM